MITPISFSVCIVEMESSFSENNISLGDEGICCLRKLDWVIIYVAKVVKAIAERIKECFNWKIFTFHFARIKN